MEKLLNIQSELKAPKGQFNNFGKYNYRSCEDILEALKPLLLKHKCTLVITDNMIEVGGRIYVKATAEIIDIESGKSINTTAFAREDESKKGMDACQVTGSASSYARKYALNGLFLIDDTKDSDQTNTGNKTEEKKETAPPPPPVTKTISKEILNPKHEKWIGAIKALTNGDTTIEAIKKKYILTEIDEEKLKEALQIAY